MATEDVLDALEDLGYVGPLLDQERFTKAVENGVESIEFTELVEWITKELHILCKLESYVNSISGPEDSSSFLLEVSSFLKEMCCPYQKLTEGEINKRLDSKEARLNLLDFLCSELQAARIIFITKPKAQMTVEMHESETARDLKEVVISLGLGKPPDNITAAQLFVKVEAKAVEKLQTTPPSVLSKPLFIGVLTEKQWCILEKLQKQMHKEYTIRRETLLKRLDVTIQSFKWSDRLKVKEDSMAKVYGPRRRLLLDEPSVHLADILASREDLAILEKTSSASVRKNTQSAVNKVLIGRVPDRGGRPEDQQAPPPEMPSWQKRTEPQGGGFSRGGYGGGDRGGGRVQSGWSGGQDRDGRQEGRGGGRGGRGGWGGRGGRGGGRGNMHQANTTQYGYSVSYDAAGTYGQQSRY